MSRLSIVPGIVSVLVAAHVVSAQQSERFHFTSPLSLSAGYDNNFVTGGQTLDDTVVLLTAPTLQWMRNTHKTNILVEYQPEFEMFSRHPELNAWDHSGTFRVSHRISARLSLEVGDSFLSTVDPSRQLDGSLLLLPRGRFNQNIAYGALEYRLDHRTTLTFRLDNAITTTALPQALAGLLDQTSTAGTLSVARTVNRHHSVTGSYSFIQIAPHDATVLAGQHSGRLNTLDVGYKYTVSPGLVLHLSGGLITSRPLTYTAAGVVEKKLKGLWVTAGYQRYLSFFGPIAPIGSSEGAVPIAQGLLPSSVYQVASFGLKGKLTRRLGAQLTAFRARDEAGLLSGSLRSWIGRCRLDYKLSERLIALTQLDLYDQNVNQLSLLPMSRKRFMGGVQILLSRRREAIAAPPPTDSPGEPNDQPMFEPTASLRDN